MYVTLKNPAAVKNAMIARDITVRALADEVEVSRATIGHLRTGHQTGATIETASKIASALDVPFEDLWTVRDFNLLQPIFASQK